MSVGLGLLRCMIDGQFKFSYLDEQGVDRSAFFGDELRVYDYMRRHVERYGTLPQVETVFVEAKVDLVEFPPEPIGFWIERVETRRQAESILAASQKMEKCVADGDVESAREIVRARAVIRVRKHHLGIFVSRRESRWSGLRTPQIVSQLLRRAA